MSFIVVLSFFLTGCVQTLNVTSEQGDILAEYIADLVLKYDKYYNQELIYDDTEAAKESNIDLTEESSDNNENIVSDNDKNTEDADNSAAQEEVPSQQPKNLNQVMNLKYFDVKYSKYGLYDSFPKDSKNTYFVLETRAGKKLLVVELKIKNKTAASKRFDMMSKDFNYELDINSENTYRPIMTLLVNDMQYIDITVSGGKTEVGYLVFEVPKSVKLKNASLIVTNKEGQAIIALK